MTTITKINHFVTCITVIKPSVLLVC
ncbi:hypothetical protein ENC_05830 [Enterobacter hormaechei]|nr:hypothetical protein ENC_05830 [Enterobacter hormaechei]